MKTVFFIFSIAFLLSLIAHAESPIQSLDQDFFGGYNAPRVRTNGLDQDFFNSLRAAEADQRPRNFSCMNVVAATPMAESARVAQVISENCAGPASRMWVPRPSMWRDSEQPMQPTGYVQICCYRKADAGRRRRAE